MRDLIIARQKLFEESKGMRNLSFKYKRDNMDKKRKEQDKKYKQWKFYDEFIKEMEKQK
jgi:hypothetical protein